MRHFFFGLLLISAVLGIIATPAMATDNITSVNITNLNDLSDAITNSLAANTPMVAANISSGFDVVAAALTDAINDAVGQIIELVLVLFVIVLAYWHRDRLLFILAAVVSFIIAVDYMSISVYIGFVLIILGVYNFFKAAWGYRRK